MNRIYNKENKKDKFIGEHLLPYMLNHIKDKGDDSKAVVDIVASMLIFPYKTADGTMLGSLNEPGVNWYFVRDGDESRLSTESYHILDDAILKKEQEKEFLHFFGEYDYISEFSDAVAIEELIEKMSREQDYTAQWWTYAYDVFILWDPKKFNINLSNATAGIENNYFLFLDKYCDEKLKKDVITQGIFRDVQTETARNLFWERIERSEKCNASWMLRCMKVPHTFVDKKVQEYEAPYQGVEETINPYILSFMEELGRAVIFPVAEKTPDAEKCNLCHRLVTEKIWNESQAAFSKAAEDSDYAAGMLVKNISGEFVPLSWDLFYSVDDFEDKEKATWSDLKVSQETEQQENEKEVIGYEGDFERVHVDVQIYERDFINRLKCIHEFSTVGNNLEDYSFGIKGDDINFYKWLWGYSKHEKLIENVLSFFSREEDVRYTVPAEHVPFVLAVLEQPGVGDKGYSFDIDMDVAYAFRKADLVNRIGRDFEDMYCVVYREDCCDRLNVQEYISQIVLATESNYIVKNKIALDNMWDHVYLADGYKDEFDACYIHVHIYNGSNCGEVIYEDALILWPSDVSDLYIRALANYVQDTYQTSVSIVNGEFIDWEEEYRNLIKGIRTFVENKRDIKPVDELYNFTAKMDDVQNFGQEKKIWFGLREQRQKIISNDIDLDQILNGGRGFLSAKYHGRCQLCGEKIPMNEQNSYFWTFHMVKKSDNKLADIESNLFCLCPSCHGEMRYGDYAGKDMSQLVEKAQKYANYIEEKIKTEEFGDDSDCLVQELVEDDIELKGFYKPIVCDVVINGKQRRIAFSWEHFMKIAFIFSDFNDLGEDEYEEVVHKEISDFKEPSQNGHKYYGILSHEPVQWHGTEYVNGYYRNRNGQTEWVSAHWRTR